MQKPESLIDLCTFISWYVVKVEMVGEVISVLEENNRHNVRQRYSRSNIDFFFLILFHHAVL
jgi:hypothetical protein